MHERDSIIFEEMLRGKLEGSYASGRQWLALPRAANPRSRTLLQTAVLLRCVARRSAALCKAPDQMCGLRRLRSGRRWDGWDGDARNWGC